MYDERGRFAGCGMTKPWRGEGAVDRCSRDPDLVVGVEVPADRLGAGIKSLAAESSTKLDDQLDRRCGDRGR
jgi:hypothetical protein